MPSIDVQQHLWPGSVLEARTNRRRSDESHAQPVAHFESTYSGVVASVVTYATTGSVWRVDVSP